MNRQTKEQFVSVIVPTYNSEQYILKALESIQKQTHQDWEIIVVDDGSTDQTEDVIQQFSATLAMQQIQYLKQAQNQGVSAARNAGIAVATGSYIAFLDSDDIWRENHLSRGIKALEEQKKDILYSPVQTFQATTYQELVCDRHLPGHLEKFPLSLLIHDMPIYPSTIVMRKEIFEQVGDFDTTLRTTEDVDFFIRVAAAGFKFLYLDSVTTLLRRGHLSLSSNKAKIKEDLARTIRKHLHTKIGSRKERYQIASMWHLAVAKHNLSDEPLKAARFFLWAWVFRWSKLKYIAGACIAIYLFCKKSCNPSHS
jgi:teichuronic acid biosynthesis glycosyltransferase TuaG